MGIRAHIVAAAQGFLDRGQSRESAVSRAGADEPRRPSSASRYDAFISYSRAVDGKLAPALQSALQRFAKPWYRMRALRVFRDDASLSANPALWSSIQEALDESRFFVLLASPEAAESQWVQKEVEYWREHKPHDRLLIALSDGAIHWDESSGEPDWRRTALPPTIAGVFGEEPRYTDLRWARREEQLTLDDPRFRNDVADIAAPLHGRPKDEILGEDVRQHRRTVRLAIAAIVLLAALAAAAGLAALFALTQRNEARAERDLATSRYLAAQARSKLDQDLPQALLLSIEALRLEDTAEARGVLLSALQHPSPELDAFLHAHDAVVTSVAFSRDGSTLASGSEDGTVVLWDVRRRQPLGPPLSPPDEIVGSDFLYTVTAVAFSPDGKSLASGDDDGTILLWDVERRRLRGAPLGKQGGGVGSIAFSADGTRLISDEAVWDVERRSRVARMDSPDPDDVGTALSPDGKTLVASGGWAGTVSFWDVSRRRRLGAPIRAHRNLIGDFAFSGDAKMLASGGWDGTVILWDVARRQRLGAPLRAARRDLIIESVAFSRDGTKLASGDTDGRIYVWNVAGRRLLATLEGHRKAVGSLAFAEDGTLASGSEDGTVILWDVERRRRLASPLGSHSEAVGTVAFSADGKTLASASNDRTIVLWDVAHRRPRGAPLRSRFETLHDLAVSPDGRTLASASLGRTIVFWDVERRRPQSKPLEGESGSADVLAFSPDGRTLVAGGKSELSLGMVTLWDVKRRRRVTSVDDHLFLTQSATSVAFSQDGAALAVGGDKGTILLWDVGSRRRTAALVGHRDVVGDVAFSPDGTMLASASEDETVNLWDVERGASLATLRGHGARVVTVAFTPDGELLASGGEDGAVRLWDVERRQPLAGSLRADTRGVRSVAFSPGGTTLATGGWDGEVLLWDTSVDSWKRRACEIANLNLAQAEWDQFIGSSRPYHRTCPSLPAGAGVPDE